MRRIFLSLIHAHKAVLSQTQEHPQSLGFGSRSNTLSHTLATLAQVKHQIIHSPWALEAEEYVTCHTHSQN